MLQARWRRAAATRNAAACVLQAGARGLHVRSTARRANRGLVRMQSFARAKKARAQAAARAAERDEAAWARYTALKGAPPPSAPIPPPKPAGGLAIEAAVGDGLGLLGLG